MIRWVGEAVVIIVSILLALWADAWLQDRSERDEERVLLETLHSDFKANEERLIWHLDQVLAASQGLGAVAGMSESELAAQTSAEFIGWVRRPHTIELKEGAIIGALQTERAGLIRSTELLAELGQYQAFRMGISELEGALVQLSTEAYVAYGLLPGSHREFAALAAAKVGYWEVYHGFLLHQLARNREVTALIEQELDQAGTA